MHLCAGSFNSWQDFRLGSDMTRRLIALLPNDELILLSSHCTIFMTPSQTATKFRRMIKTLKTSYSLVLRNTVINSRVEYFRPSNEKVLNIPSRYKYQKVGLIHSLFFNVLRKTKGEFVLYGILPDFPNKKTCYNF